VGHDEVRRYYASFGQREWDRLAAPADGALEFAVTRHVIERYMPAAGRVLDIGGGPGRYALWLAERGQRVVLADLSAEMLAIARQRLAEVPAGQRACVEQIVEADACDLSRWGDASFDAVLCLGPFYHLPDARDRQRAAAELGRVVRPGGVVFIAFMPRFALLRRTLAMPDERHRLAQPTWLARLLDQGTFDNDVPGRFTHGYGARPQEIGPFLAAHGFEQLTLVSCEGLAIGLQDALGELPLDDPVLKSALDIVVDTAADPSILGVANHLLYVGRRT